MEQPAVSSGNRPALTVRPSAEPAPPLKRGAWEIMAAGSGKTTVVELAVAHLRDLGRRVDEAGQLLGERWYVPLVKHRELAPHQLGCTQHGVHLGRAACGLDHLHSLQRLGCFTPPGNGAQLPPLCARE